MTHDFGAVRLTERPHEGLYRSPILIDRATGGPRRRNLPFECTMRRVAAAVPRSSNLWPSGETNFMVDAFLSQSDVRKALTTGASKGGSIG